MMKADNFGQFYRHKKLYYVKKKQKKQQLKLALKSYRVEWNKDFIFQEI